MQFPDDLTSCYNQIKTAMISSVSSETGGDCLADYTGGTKTMAVALAIAALDLNWRLSVVRGERTDLIKTKNGTEMSQGVPTSQFLLERGLTRAAELFDLGEYDAAESIARSLPSQLDIEASQVARVQRMFTLSRGFAAWDRFEHDKALTLLEPQAKLVAKHVRSLKELLGYSKGCGYEKVWDLLKNAERRAQQGRYDDAVLRLYRALEMLAQIRLRKEYQLDTDDIKLDKLPETAQKRFAWQVDQKRERITAGLHDSYCLLHDLNDPAGQIFNNWKNKIMELLNKRNRSILAHGEEPIGKEKWEEADSLVRRFLEEVASAIPINIQWPVFPTWEQVKEQL
jgi:hypothetical protein